MRPLRFRKIYRLAQFPQLLITSTEFTLSANHYWPPLLSKRHQSLPHGSLLPSSSTLLSANSLWRMVLWLQRACILSELATYSLLQSHFPLPIPGATPQNSVPSEEQGLKPYHLLLQATVFRLFLTIALTSLSSETFGLPRYIGSSVLLTFPQSMESGLSGWSTVRQEEWGDQLIFFIFVFLLLFPL